MIAGLVGHVISLGVIPGKSTVVNIGFMSGDMVYAIEAGPAGSTWLAEGGRRQIYVWHIVRQDEQTFYAFATAEERALAIAIGELDGFGPRKAAVVVQQVGVTALTRLIAAGDVAAIQTAAKGIGAVGARRLVEHLKGHVSETHTPSVYIEAANVAARGLAALGLRATVHELADTAVRLSISDPTQLINRYLQR